MDKLVTFIDRC